ncbi:hypothetical protein QBC35DRAFT_493856 [Podospora australis]|uniref:Kinetochore protein Sos7 coiled-coil domain-containing protein n=1 Tax=Podospora australis TaxID=1536484 RepID=A0AAN6WX67_9PEZI|nr:hypothetical protein QBC35DRAFT_493856 [Podospora australis]
MPGANNPSEDGAPPRRSSQIDCMPSFVEELQRKYPWTIIRISDFGGSDAPAARTSDASNASFGTPTPTSLEADLLHYKELFAKLRFSYVEQVTKEKTIRSMVGDPPQIVSPQENAELEAENSKLKEALQDLKAEVAARVTMTEARSRELARKYEHIQTQHGQMRPLPDKIDRLEREIARLSKTQTELLGGPDNLSLVRMLEIQTLRKREEEDMRKQLAILDAVVPRKKKELERLTTELHGWEIKRANATAAAREAKRRKENAQAGGNNNGEDELEAQGRWHRAGKILLDEILLHKA